VFVHVTTSFRSQQGVTVQTAAPSRPLIHTPIYLTIRLKTHIYHTIMRQREQLANVNISHMCDVRLSAGKAHRSLRSSLPPQVLFRRSCYTGQDGTVQDLPHPPADREPEDVLTARICYGISVYIFRGQQREHQTRRTKNSVERKTICT